MSERITKKQLQGLCERLNRMTGSPMEAWTRHEDGRYKANIGNYHLTGAYGGVTLYRMHNDGGGVTTPLSCGFISKRDLYNRIHAYLSGIEEGIRLMENKS